jgi:uncharacterized protein YaiI (UPF0178 family)
MKIWVDADACPNPIKEILFRAAERTGIANVLFQGDIPLAAEIIAKQAQALSPRGELFHADNINLDPWVHGAAIDARPDGIAAQQRRRYRRPGAAQSRRPQDFRRSARPNYCSYK